MGSARRRARHDNGWRQIYAVAVNSKLFKADSTRLDAFGDGRYDFIAHLVFTYRRSSETLCKQEIYFRAARSARALEAYFRVSSRRAHVSGALVSTVHSFHCKISSLIRRRSAASNEIRISSLPL